jgi:hypothetical protein
MLKLQATPFGSHFSTRLEGVNNKLICALSALGPTTCTDDTRPTTPVPTRPIFEVPIEETVIV